MLVGKIVLTSADSYGADGHDNDVVAAEVGFFENLFEVFHMAPAADGDKDAAWTGFETVGGNFHLVFEIELLEAFVLALLFLPVYVFADREEREEDDGKTDAVDSGDFL